MSNKLEIGSRVYSYSILRIGTVTEIHADGCVSVQWKHNSDILDAGELNLFTNEVEQEFNDMVKSAKSKIDDATQAMKKFESSLEGLNHLVKDHNKYDILRYMAELGLCNKLEEALGDEGWSASSLYC